MFNHSQGIEAMRLLIVIHLAIAGLLVSSGAARGQEKAATMALAGGKLSLKAPADWVAKPPQSPIIEYEYSIPAVKGDSNDGRLTVMAAGGGVDANIERWYGQFTQPDGGSTRDRAKIKKFSVAGEDVHLVDLSGTYKDQRGPAAPAVERPKYRMLAAIIATKNAGNYFIKLYGPERTVTEQEAAFVKMVEGLEKK
jgi:hypothetical protein